MIILILYWLSFRWFPLFWHRWLFWVALVLVDGFLVALMSGFPLRLGVTYAVTVLMIYQSIRWTYKGFRWWVKSGPKDTQAT
jgi:hypothetical protein